MKPVHRWKLQVLIKMDRVAGKQYIMARLAEP